MEVSQRKRKLHYYFYESDSTDSEIENMTPEEKKKHYEDLSTGLYLLHCAGRLKTPKPEPEFNLNNYGRNAEVIINDCKTGWPNLIVEPLYTEDIYMTVFRSITSLSKFDTKFRWGSFEQARMIEKTLLLVVEGFIKSDLLENMSELNNIDIFKHVVETASPNIHFATELSTLHLVTDFHIQNKNTYSTIFSKGAGVKIETSVADKFLSKLNLLLSPVQMLKEHFPMPDCNFKGSKCDNYVFTKESYSPVSKDSPVFALDCEMCTTTENSELTRISVVNENCDVIYHTLVKPDNKIIDYLTRFSGVTEKMLRDVTVKLRDVQQQLQKILPPDAILIGHSLNCDLHALKMMHPYVIDTSIIFNECGMSRGNKRALKTLAFDYLDKTIQNKNEGHEPTEDAVTAMQLVKLKLRDINKTGRQYIYSQVLSSFGENYLNNDNGSSGLSINSNSKKVDSGFFPRIIKRSKKCCLVGNDSSLKYYDKDMLTDNVKKNIESNREGIIKATLKEVKDNNLIISHINYDQTCEQETLKEFNAILKQLYDAHDHRYMFMVLISGVDENNYSDIKSGLLMSVLKLLD
ncbi:RNA exonuclease 5 [Trichonephila clavata]|uniref:RNA exonuclease 5 n=1 Tax=Trichonephila clavata TaxID=2740835 RepID=A0A8X6HN55_TRICU|nr:RNA exonuclease 5 [Trichonephila clavata]